MSDEDWIDITCVGSPYQVQLNASSNSTRWRRYTAFLPDGDPFVVEREWQYGELPREVK